MRVHSAATLPIIAISAFASGILLAKTVFPAPAIAAQPQARLGTGGLQFAVMKGNALPFIRLTADGWVATIQNANSPIRCAIFIGSTPMPPATNEGEPKCQ